MPFPVTPSNTATVTPTKSVTPSLTPTETPTGTVCPISPSVTPTFTPTPSITQTITPTVSLGACRSYTASKISTFLSVSDINWTDCYGVPQSQTLENPPVTYPESITFCALAGSLVYLNTEISVVDNGPCVPVTQTITPTVTQTNTPSNTPTLTPTNTITPTITNTPSNTPTLTPTNTMTPSPSGSAFTPEYQSILNYANSAGFTLPSSTGQTRQNQFIIDLKNAGLWNKYDIFYVFATDGDSNFARLNWKNPSVYSAQTSGGTSITFTSKQGFNASAGSGTYLNTQWTPSTQATAFTQNDANILYYDFDNNTGTTAVGYCGYVETLGGTSNIVMNGTNVNTQRLNTLTNTPSTFDFRGIGTKIMDRTSSGSTTYYNNTSTGTTYTGLTSTALAAFTLDILRYGSGAANFSSNKCSIFGAGGSISGSTSSLLNAINSYMTGL